MPLIEGDLATYALEGARGRLRPDLLHLRPGWSVCIMLASAGYPAGSSSGDLISGLEKVNGVRVYHCGTRRNADGRYETSGGRVLAIVAQAESREAARAQASAQADLISFPGRQRRSDIGLMHFI